MRRFIFPTLIGLSIVMFGCVHLSKPAELEISDDLLENLSKDLAEINLMVESAGGKYKVGDLKAKVIEPWSSAVGKKFAISTASGREEFPVLAVSKIEVPTSGGYTTAMLMKLESEKGKFVGVLEPKMMGGVFAALPKTAMAGKYPVRFYDPSLARDKASYEAITQYVSLTSRLERATKEILERLAEIKKKYAESPIYIEGFSLSLPLISVQIQFKFKK